MTKPSLDCFKTYDIRGQVPDQLNQDLAYKIGRAFVQVMKTTQIVVGRDIRLSGLEIETALVKGITDQGCRVIELGLIGTEEMYFATSFLEKEGVDGGIIITASHNPKDYNGMKMVKKGSRPINGDTELKAIEQATLIANFGEKKNWNGLNPISKHNLLQDYIEHMFSYIDISKLKPLKLICDGAHGNAGPVAEALLEKLPFTYTILHKKPDGSFPIGVPNPLLPENRTKTSKAVIEAGADLGIAWDGDFDRCFFFDEKGDFVDAYYVIGLFAEYLLKGHPKDTAIIHDPRLLWNTIEKVENAGGKAVFSVTGHAFIKEKMREVDAIYGGEMSAHHYFKKFAYCDSGMIPWLLMTAILSEKNQSLSNLVAEQKAKYPISGEINYKVADADLSIEKIKTHFKNDAIKIENIDGLSMTFAKWRFSLRKSNTEPLLRLNIESRGDQNLVTKKLSEIEFLIKN